MFHRILNLRPTIVLFLVVSLVAVGSVPAADATIDKSRDPTFASVSSHFPAMKFPREAIGVKDHRDEFIIMPDGRVAFSPSRKNYTRQGYVAKRSGRAFFTLDNSKVWLAGSGSGLSAKKRLVDGYMPIVIADFEGPVQLEPGLKYEQTAVAWSEGMSADEPIWAFVRMKVSNAGDSKRKVNLSWNVDYGIKKERKIRKVASWDIELAPGSKKIVYGKLPFLGGYKKAAKSSDEEFDKRFAEASAFWKKLLNKGTRIKVPEQRVNDAYRAWLAYTFLNVDKIGSMYEPHDGSGFYERIYGIMAVKFCNMLGLMDYPEEAQTYLDSLQTLISPEGHFRVNFGTTDMGVLLLVMADHYRLTGDESWLREAAPRMVKMCDWIINKRKEVKAGQEEGSLCYGLISSNVGVDNPGAYYSYVTDTTLCVGMEATVEVLRMLGMKDDAARIQKESLAYRQDVEKSMHRAVAEHDGMKVLPVMPDTHKYLKRAAYTPGGKGDAAPGKGYSGHGYYALFGSIVLETKFLPAADERFRPIAELLERRDGLLMGMCAFGVKGGIDHAFTYGYWMNCLERDEVERVLLGFYGSMAYGMSRGTWAGVECTNIFTGVNARTLPHLRSGTQQLRLLRNMLVREQDDELILAQAVPRDWLEHGKQVRVENAPTLFGKVGYTIDSRVDDGRISIQIDPPTGKKAPDAIKLYLRHPRKEAIKAVTANGIPVEEFTTANVTLKKLKGRTVVEVDYQQQVSKR